MEFFKMSATVAATTTTLTIGFGAPAQNSEIVREVASLQELAELPGGKLLLVNGPASLPVAFVIAHATCHKYGAIGVFDPKMAGYVISVSHDPEYQIGDVIPA